MRSKKTCKIFIVQQHSKAVGHQYSLFSIKYHKYSYSVTETLAFCVKKITRDVILEASICHILSHIDMQIFCTQAVQNFFSFKSYSVKIGRVCQIFLPMKRWGGQRDVFRLIQERCCYSCIIFLRLFLHPLLQAALTNSCVHTAMLQDLQPRIEKIEDRLTSAICKQKLNHLEYFSYTYVLAG